MENFKIDSEVKMNFREQVRFVKNIPCDSVLTNLVHIRNLPILTKNEVIT